MLRKMRYTPREHRHLHLGRPRVVLVGPVLPDDLLFVLDYRQLLLSPLLLFSSTLGLSPFKAICYHMHQRAGLVIRRASSTSRAICSLRSSTPVNLFSGRIL